MRAPESSAFGTNPRAPERATSGPKSDESRLETSTMCGPVAVGQPRGDVEAVDVGQLDVEQHEIGPQAARLLDPGGAVGSLADHVEPLRLEQHAGARTKGGVVVDDEDGQRHRDAIVNAGDTISYTAGYTPAASAISRNAAAGSAAPNTAEPATNSVAPACAHAPAVLASTPPSTSSAGPAPISARRRSILPGLCGDERLAAPARVDRHAEREVEVRGDLGERPDRRGGADRDARPCSPPP